ncbi:MAG: hypothetical protein IKU24_00495, partial [Clostridia bacterium]|nr:hypothetical protein [Clostridia bacterium]
MLKKKNLSVILAVVLLCTCIAGVLFIGAQAADTKYYMTVGDSAGAWAGKVPSDMTFLSNHSSINDAMTAAKKHTWAAKDTLTIYVTASGTTTPSFTSGTSGRHLFNIYTIFRDDNTKLPVEINGDDPSTSSVEKASLGLGTPSWNKDFDSKTMTASFMATNDYTFKNLDLSAWASSSYIFYSGSGNVTFDNVTLSSASTNEKLVICSQIGAWTSYEGWNKAKWDANADESGIVDSGFAFKDTVYGRANGTLTSRCSNLNISGSHEYEDITVTNNMFRNKLVFLEGASAQNVFIHSVTGMTAERAPYENVIEVDGGAVGVVYGVRSSYPGAANRHVCNIKSGSVNSVRMGSQNGATYTGDIIVNWTGGTVTNYGSVYSGKVAGNVYNNISGVTFANAETMGVGFNATATVEGTLYNNLSDCTISGQVYLGAKGQATNVHNKLSGTITTSDNYAYMGTNSQTIQGNVTNELSCDWVYTGTSADHYVMGGSASGTISGKVTNTIDNGANFRHDYIGGSNNGPVLGGVENTIKGGYVKNFLGGNSFNNTTALSSIKNTLLGGKVELFRGASGDYTAANAEKGIVEAYAVVTKVENVIGQKNEDGTYSGDVHVTKFYGGAYDESIRIGEIENTYYSGKFGTADREGSGWYTTNFGYGGSYRGIVGAIRNTFYGGTFNTQYFYGGNGSNAAFGADGGYTLKDGESQVTNYVYGGHFARFAGGSNGGNIDTIQNYVSCAYEASATSRDSAFYCGHGASAKTTVRNEITGLAPVSLSAAGELKDTADPHGVIYGGANADTVGNIITVIKNGAKIGTFYGGSNGGRVIQVTTTVTKDAGSEVAPEIAAYLGCNRSPKETTDLITNNIEAGEIREFYAAHYRAQATSEVVSLVNNLKGGLIHKFLAGNNQETTTETKEDGSTETIYVHGAIGTITNNVNEGSTIQINTFYGAGATGTIGKVVNNFKSSTATLGAVYGGAYGTSSYLKAYQGAIVNNITNNITAGNFESFYGGSRRGQTVKIRTNITGGTFGELYGANNQATLENTTDDLAVQTTIENAVVTGNVYGGSYFAEIKGNIKTIFYSGSFGGDTYTGNRFGNIIGNVTGTVNGGDFNRYFGGSDGLDLYGKKHYTKKTVDGAIVNITVITGDVINYINGGTFSGATQTKNKEAADFALILGGNYGDIVGSVTSNINGPVVAEGKMSIGGGFMNNITAAGSNGYAIKNTIGSGTFYSFWGGSYRNSGNSYKITGNIINNVNGGTFNTATGATTYNAWSGGCINAGHTGNVTNTITGGTFNGYLNPGTYVTGDAWARYRVGSVTTDLKGGTFNGKVHVCSFSGFYENTSGSVNAATMNIYNSCISKSSVTVKHAQGSSGISAVLNHTTGT